MNIIYAEKDIGIVDDVFPPNTCEQLISVIDNYESNNLLTNRQKGEGVPKSAKDDLSICVHTKDIDTKIGCLINENKEEVYFSDYLKYLHLAFGKYSDSAVYENIKSYPLSLPLIKFQKTMPGGGYHVWHHERGDGLELGRYVAFIMYLNTILPENAGETEFIRQELRVNPKENTIVFWPATYTHPHRGNPVYGSTPKYVLTGWLFI
jgi:hypothetical protein